MPFKPDEHFAAIFLRKAAESSFFMLRHAERQIAGYTGVERAISAARHDVIKSAFFHPPSPWPKLVTPAKAGAQS